MPPRGLPRRGLLAATTLAVAGCGAQGVPPTDERLATAFPVAPIPGSPLTPLGGLVVNTERLGFGGLSGLVMDQDLRITAVSDLARWMSARLVLEGETLAGLAELRTGWLGDGAGRPLARGHAGDAEALARTADGTLLVGFERWHRIRAYPHGLDGPGLYVEAPPGLENAPGNGGLETLTVLADGRWLAIAESQRMGMGSGVHRAWIGGPGRWTTFGWRTDGQHAPVDAAGLPDGGALVLERDFSLFRGFRARLMRIGAAPLRAVGHREVVQGEEILRLDRPLPADNWEGVAVARHQGRLLVALVTDDNESRLQSTMILLFALAEDG
jgi:hypothetical protein